MPLSLDSIGELDALRLEFRLDARTASGRASGTPIGISAGDLVFLSALSERVSGAVARRAAWRLLAQSGLPDAERLEIVRGVEATTDSFADGQVGRLERGSIEIGLSVVPGLIVGWLAKDLIGAAVRQGWEESAWCQQVVDASRNLFGGSVDTIERAVAVAPVPSNIAIEAVSTGATVGDGPHVRVIARKVDHPELEAFEEAEAMLAAARLPQKRESSGERDRARVEKDEGTSTMEAEG